MLYFDLDEFKPINDRFGHAEGDHALMSFAGLLKRTFRESDVIGRLGGDEFAVLVSDAVDGELDKALERMRASVDAHNSEANRGYDLRYSVGAVQYDAARHTDVSALTAEADTFMYEAKGQKRQASRNGRATAA